MSYPDNPDFDDKLNDDLRALGLDPSTLVRGPSVTLPIPSHDECAAIRFEQGSITAACRETPCLPCDGKAVKGPCACGCHKVKAGAS